MVAPSLKDINIMTSLVSCCHIILKCMIVLQLSEVFLDDCGTHSVSACCHVLFGIVVVLDQFGGELIQGLETSRTKTLSPFLNRSRGKRLARENAAGVEAPLTVIFSSWALSDFSKSSCFLSRASTLSRESPRSSFSRKAWTPHAHNHSSASCNFTQSTKTSV